VNLPLRVLDVGCGNKKRPGAIGVDNNIRTAADVIHDLNCFPYPLGDNEFDYVYADNIIEHLDDVVKVLEKLHRITKAKCEAERKCLVRPILL